MGLTVSTALGAPIGALIGGLGDWHWTMVFVAALAAASALGISAFLSHIPVLPIISLRQRLAPLADARMGLTLATTFLFLSAAFTIYTYLAVVFDRATNGNPAALAGLIVLWGAAGTVSTFVVGRLIDVTGNRKVLVTLLALLTIDFVLMPWTGPVLGRLFRRFFSGDSSVGVHLCLSSIASLSIAAAYRSDRSRPQQHRHLPRRDGGCGYRSRGHRSVGGPALGYIAAALAAAALIAAELAAHKIAAGRPHDVAPLGRAEQSKT